jgi:hypothetical protein
MSIVDDLVVQNRPTQAPHGVLREILMRALELAATALRQGLAT